MSENTNWKPLDVLCLVLIDFTFDMCTHTHP